MLVTVVLACWAFIGLYAVVGLCLLVPFYRSALPKLDEKTVGELHVVDGIPALRTRSLQLARQTTHTAKSLPEAGTGS